MTNLRRSSEDDNVAADFIADSLSVKAFFRTISYRDGLTALTCCLLMEAFTQTSKYYSDETFFENWFTVIQITGFFLIVLANHVSYRFEHGRSNNFMGRALFDMFFLLSLSLTNFLYLRITDQNDLIGSADIGEILGGMLGVAIVIFGFEFLVSLLKYLLKYLRCPVL